VRINPKLLTLLLLGFCGIANAQLTITVKTAAQAAAVVNNDFVSATGLFGAATGVTFRGNPEGLATFTGTSNLGITQGIILSSGLTSNIDNPAAAQIDHSDWGGANVAQGDVNLQTLSTTPIRDVAVLEFDFIPRTDTIRFRYAFASEEYPEYVCNVFNDVFGFFISGPKPGGGNYVAQNVALIPGTAVPVGVNTVNPGVPGTASGGGTCNLANQSLAYSTYYVGNTGSTVIFDGFTVVMEAVIPVVMCGDYHIKLAVGDASDGVFDSGVFLESKTFGGGFIHVMDTVASIGLDTSVICKGDTIQLIAPNATSYNWGAQGTTQTINVTQPGGYQFVTMNPANGCFNVSYTYVVLQGNPIAEIDTLGSMTLCAGDSVQLFSTFPGSAYLWSNGATTSSIWVDYSQVGTYTLTVTDINGRCDSTSSPVTVYSGSAAAVITPAGATNFCAGGSVTLNANPGTSYLWSNGATTASISATTSGNYIVTVNNGGCAASSLPTAVVVNNPVVAIAASGPLTFCQGANVTLTASAGFSGYNWSSGSTADNITASTTGNYTVTVTDAIGCTATSNVNVTVNSATASIAALTDSVLCPGDSIQLSANAGSSYLWSNGKSSQNIWVNSAGSYSVTVTNANTCVASSSPVNIYMSIPSATIVSPSVDTTICIGNNLTLTASGGVSYNWSTGATSSSFSLVPGTSNTYTVTVTNADGCNATANVDVTVNDPQVTIVNNDPLSFCLGDSAIISATPGFANYAWSTGQSGLVTNITLYSATNVSVIVTDADGCVASSNALQTQTNSAVVNVNLSTDPVLCPLEQITLQASAAVSYLWSNGATTASITTGPGAYAVTITDANGCVASSVPVVITQSTPTASIVTSTGILVFCPDSSLELIANPGSIYSWSTGSASQNIFISNPGTYTVTVTNADNCSLSASISVSESTPIANITNSGPTTFCKGDQVTLTANAGSSYLWSDGNTSGTITVGTAGVYTVTVADTYGCPATDDVTIVVNEALAVISPSIDSIFCSGDSIQLNNTSANTVSVQWSNGQTGSSIWVNDNNSYSFILTDINGCKDTSSVVNTSLSVPVATITPQSSLVICPNTSVVLAANTAAGSTYVWSDGSTASTFSASANGNYTVTVTNVLGCSAESAPVTVIVSIPSASIIVTGPTDLCPGEQANLTANFGASYSWSNGATTQQLLTSTGGSYSVDVTDTAGCVASSGSVTITNLPAEATTAVSGVTSFCRGGSVTITALTPGLNYVWSDGTTGPSVTVSNSGIITVAITNMNGCVASSTPVTVTVHEYPVISFVADSSSECDAFKIRFRNYSVYDNGSIFAWTFGDSTTSNQISPVHWYTDNGTYNVTLTITTPAGCASSDSNEIEVVRYPDPVAKFVMENNIENVFAGPITFINQSTGAVRFLWDFGDRSGSTEVNPTHDYREPGYYKVSLTAFNPANCEDKETKEVTVAPLFIPSAFTPNGDGKNDIFPGGLPTNLDVNAYQVSIFNRWGERIFFSDNPAIGWNGNGRDGSIAPNGGYVYELIVTDKLNKDFSFKGQFTLLR
jgi:large repetitive protein